MANSNKQRVPSTFTEPEPPALSTSSSARYPTTYPPFHDCLVPSLLPRCQDFRLRGIPSDSASAHIFDVGVGGAGVDSVTERFSYSCLLPEPPVRLVPPPGRQLLRQILQTQRQSPQRPRSLPVDPLPQLGNGKHLYRSRTPRSSQNLPRYPHLDEPNVKRRPRLGHRQLQLLAERTKKLQRRCRALGEHGWIFWGRPVLTRTKEHQEVHPTNT
jgi:hypothetical protein